MLDAEAAVLSAVLALDPLEDVELRTDRAIADRVHDDVQSRAVGARYPCVKVGPGA